MTSLGVEEGDLTTDALLIEDLGMDSLDLVELTIDLEQQYAIPEIDPEVAEGWKTVGDVLAYVTAHAAAT